MRVLVWENPTYGRAEHRREWDPRTEVAPTVQANGIAGCCLSHSRLVTVPDPQEAWVPDPDKPPYRIPLVAEIAEREGTAGLVAASTFAGAGGSSTGYRWAGYDVRWASEYHDGAADSYEANWPGCTVDRRDVREVPGAEILEACGVNELDLLDGSPPCQPFSLAGQREKSWGREVEHGDGTRNAGGSEDLVGEWVRLVAEIRPRAAVMENVKGLTTGKAKGHLLQILEHVRGLGYDVGVRLLDAQWLGVPQRRVRVFVVAVREDVGAPAFPDPLPYRYTIADACPWLASSELDLPGHGWFDGETIDADEQPSATVCGVGMPSRDYAVRPAPPDGDGPPIAGTCLEGEWDRLKPGEQSDRYHQLVRAHPDQPSATVVAATGGHPGTAGVTAPHEPRKFTIAECRRLCGFPDDYQLTGGYADQWARLGNSVPPPVARAVGAALAEVLAR